MGSTRDERDFIAALSMKLGVAAFAVEERLPLGQMYVLRRGMVVRLWRFLGRGKVSAAGSERGTSNRHERNWLALLALIGAASCPALPRVAC